MAKAIGVTQFGGPEALEVLDLEPEPLGPDDIRIRVSAVAVNPTDTLRRAGGQSETDQPPAPGVVPGMDAVGEVVEVGDQVSGGPSVGDRVMAIVVPNGVHGAYRSDLVVPARSAALVPAGASDAEAATLPMNGLTARQALDRLALQPGQTLAVTGAAGTLGGYVIVLAKQAGLRVIADAADKDLELVRGFGADIVVARGDDVAEAIRARVPDGVDGLVDGSVQGEAVLAAVKDGGAMATVRGWDGGDQDRIRVEPVMVAGYVTEQEKLDELRALVESGAIALRVAGEFPAEQAADAHRALEAGGSRGRFVVTF